MKQGKLHQEVKMTKTELCDKCKKNTSEFYYLNKWKGSLFKKVKFCNECHKKEISKKNMGYI